MNEEYLKVVTQLGRPIPGQSLTENPDNPAPYEKPPQFTSVHEASEFIFGNLIEEESYVQIMQLLADGMPIMDVVRTLLFTGFTEGKWSPDLMLMLAEPVAYMLLALSEQAGIDAIIYRGEDEDEVEDMAMFGTELDKNKIKKMRTTPKAQMLTPEMAEQIAELPPINESLLAPPAPTEEEVQ